MSMDYFEAWQQEAEEQFWENVPKQLHEESVKVYLGVYGDAIDARVDNLSEMAGRLQAAGEHGATLTVAATTIEIMIQYFCVRPIVEGAFLSDVWATTLAKWIVEARAQDQRKILVGFLRIWNIDLNEIKLRDGTRRLWQTIHELILPKRNQFVHRGGAVTLEDATTALECAECFRREIVSQFAARLGFTLDKTREWARTEHGEFGSGMRFCAGDPFVAHRSSVG